VQGSITKTGNGHARRLLVEAAWHHRARYQPGKTIRDRWDLASPAARARGDLGNRRLHARWVTYVDRKKKATVANTAIARELAGWRFAGPARGVTHPTTSSSVTVADGSARSQPAKLYEQPQPGVMLVSRHAEHSCRNARPAVTNPRISV
jgi:hypothetical protein